MHEFFAIALAHFIAVASPGPDFLIVLRHATNSGSRTAIVTSLGIACGIAIHCILAITGLSLIISNSPALRSWIQVLGCAYLIYLGITAVRSKTGHTKYKNPPPIASSAGAFFQGFTVNLLNVKATLFFIALFSGLISNNTLLSTKLVYGAYLSIATFIWFAIVATLLTTPAPRRFFDKFEPQLNKSFGMIIMLLGILGVLEVYF